MRVGGERVEVRQRAEGRVDVAVVGDVVAEVGHRRAVERRQPDAVDAEPLQVGQPPPDALEVTGAVAVGVLERARIDLVDGAVAPPGHVQAASSASASAATSSRSRARRRRKPCATAWSRKAVEAVVVAGGVEHRERLVVDAEVAPRVDLDQLLERADPARQRDERVRELGHQRLALVHVVDDVQLGQAACGRSPGRRACCGITPTTSPPASSAASASAPIRPTWRAAVDHPQTRAPRAPARGRRVASR